MATRKIVVISTTKSQPKEFYSEATTYGQLKDTLSEFGDLSKMRVVVKQTKTTLELDEAVLPDTDITLFITPKQIKAGSSNTTLVDALRALQEKIYDAFSEVIDSIEDGEFDGDEDEEEYPAPKKASGPVISDEDRDFLNEMKNLG